MCSSDLVRCKVTPNFLFSLKKLGLVSQVPLDYMHLVCLGVVKKLLSVWTEGKMKLAPRCIKQVSLRLIGYAKFIPKNFVRKPRSLKELSHWKATEFRTFVLYVGPLALKRILQSDRFDHFMLLHTAIYILISEAAFQSEWVNYAGELLRQFVFKVPSIYDKHLLSYNMHSLQHLHLDSLTHGPLDRISAFNFENHMQTLKRLLRTNHQHLRDRKSVV